MSSPPSIAPGNTASKATFASTEPATQQQFLTYRAQLTFGLSSCREVNLANLFYEWFEAMHNHLKGFSLLPYTLDNGQQITMTSQMSKADESMLKEYYSKNCVLQHGNLTGMVHFQTSTPWSAVKGFNSQYFSWLKKHKMYLNLTKFKPDTLVPSGFLVGTHPSFLR